MPCKKRLSLKSLLLLAALAPFLLLQGCYTPLIEGAQEGYDGARRDALEAGAKAGTAKDQYELGNTYCCQGAGPLHDASVYDNVKATRWYCRAARQGYGPAQLRLARLYSGHPIRGLHIVLRASNLMGTPERNMSLALMWASVAEEHGVDEAAAERDEISSHATAPERARAVELAKEWRTAPCNWNEVFPADAKVEEKK
jgi:TPR repeat protein